MCSETAWHGWLAPEGLEAAAEQSNVPVMAEIFMRSVYGEFIRPRSS